MEGALVSQLKEIGRKIGEGSYGSVVEVNVGGKLYAGKRLHAFFYRSDVPLVETEAMAKRFEEECRRMLRLKHRNIVEVIGVHINPKNRQPTLVMELLPTSLSRYLETHPATPSNVKYSILLDVCRGLGCLHDQSIIHRDLTANNVLLTADTTAKIADFGQARILNKNPAQLFRSNPWSQIPGNPAHMAPEAFLDHPIYDTKLDMFSFGVVMLHTLTQEWPEPSSDRVQAPNEPSGYRMVNEVERRMLYIEKVDNPLLKSRVIQCLHSVSKLRPSANELTHVLEMVKQQISAREPQNAPRMVLEQSEVVQNEAYRFKVQDRVVAFKNDGTPIHGTVQWVGMYEVLEKKNRPFSVAAVGIETDVKVGGSEMESCLPPKHHLFATGKKKGSLFMREVEVMLESDFGTDNSQQPPASSDQPPHQPSQPHRRGQDGHYPKTNQPPPSHEPAGAAGGSHDNPLQISTWETEDQTVRNDQITNYLGDGRGIQGYKNSSYLDATIFGLFALSDVFDSLFLDSVFLQHKDTAALTLAQQVQRDIGNMLWRGIVNPLRKNGAVRYESVMKLRNRLDDLGKMEGVNTAEKDPEEFLNMLFKHALCVEPFIKIKRPYGTEPEFFVQLFVEFDESLKVPTIQALLEKMFKEQQISFDGVPSKLLVQVPRYGKQFQTYKRIIPGVKLDPSPLIDCPYTCFICKEKAWNTCNDCYSEFATHRSSDGRVYFCNDCNDKVHRHKSRTSHNPEKCRELYEVWGLELLSVLCIETSHYVCFTRDSEGRWLFFDSMANRVHDQYNIPRGVDCTDQLNDWVYKGSQERLMATGSRDLPELVRRFTQDVYMCVYIPPDYGMYA